MEEIRDTAIAFSDWEAIRLSSLLRREERKRKRLEKERTAAAAEAAAVAEAASEKPETPRASGDFAGAWPGQRIIFDEAVIRKKGYVRSVQTVLSGVQGYTFYKEDGTGQFLRPEMLLVQKMAHKPS